MSLESPIDNLAFQRRLEVCVQKAGGKLSYLAKRSEIPLTTLLRYFEGSEPSREKLVAIARAADVSVGWLANGEESAAEKQPLDLDSPQNAPRSTAGYLRIPWIEGSHREEDGRRELQFAPKIGWLPFEYFHDGLNGVNPAHLAAFRMDGNEMEPDIRAGEIVIVDTSDRQREVSEGMRAVRIATKITVRDVVQISLGNYALRHLRTPPNQEGIRFSAEDLGRDFDILGRIIVTFRYPMRGLPIQSA